MILILMGVSGVGKTTIGQLLSRRAGWRFEDADDYHSDENRRRMAAGIPLTDADRLPWLGAVHARISQYLQEGKSAVFACSALKQQYRATLTGGFAESEIRFVYLYAPAALIRERTQLRNHPYMNPNLLDSQMATLEEPSGAWQVSATESPEQSVNDILGRLRGAGLIDRA